MTPHRTGESADKQPHTAEPIKPPVTQQLSLLGLPSVRPGSGIGKAGKFPASWENTGNFARWVFSAQANAPNSSAISRRYSEIPCASQTGNFLRLNREVDRVIREYSGRLGKCGSKKSDNQ